MKRIAILIGLAGKKYSNEYLNGVEIDIQNYIRFLSSPTGGAWSKSEIITIINPDRDNLIQTFHQLNTDYLLTVFSGYGTQTLSKELLFLGLRNQCVSLRQLISITDVPKQLFIIDACRSFIESDILSFLGEELRSFPSRLTKAYSLLLFNSYLRRCKDGVIICNSTSIGEKSFGNNNGGFFTLSLLDTAKKWVDEPSKFDIFPINKAFIQSKNYLVKHLTNEQTPQLRATNKRTYWFPFAVRKANGLH